MFVFMLPVDVLIVQARFCLKVGLYKSNWTEPVEVEIFVVPLTKEQLAKWMELYPKAQLIS